MNNKVLGMNPLENKKSDFVPEKDVFAKFDETFKVKENAMKHLALNQLELNYRLAAINGLLANPEHYTLSPFTLNIEFVLAEADKIAKAALAKWHGDMIS